MFDFIFELVIGFIYMEDWFPGVGVVILGWDIMLPSHFADPSGDVPVSNENVMEKGFFWEPSFIIKSFQHDLETTETTTPGQRQRVYVDKDPG